MGAMIKARVCNGQVVMDHGAILPEGAELLIQVVAAASPPTASNETPTLYERLKPIIGKAVGLPADAALNHDHYLYGTPKK